MRLAAIIAALLIATSARAETGEIRIAQQYGMGYLPLHVALDRKLIETHARAAGLGDVKISLAQFSSGPATNDALISGNVDFAMGGGTVMMTLWDKTLGRQNVRGVVAFCDSPIYLITFDPRIRTIRDFTDADRIAVTGIKVTQQALMLQMVAAKEYGWESRFRFDPLTVAMSHPDAFAAVTSGRHEVKTHAATVPFNFEELADPRARLVMTSNEVAGGKHTAFALFTSETWRKANPRTYAAVAAAFEEAIELIGKDKRAAAESYVKLEKTKLTAEQVEAILRKEDDISYSATPHRTMVFAEFMHRLGTLRNLPASWKDMFFDNLHDKAGS